MLAWMLPKKQEPLAKTNKVSKAYTYKKGDASLSFTLDIEEPMGLVNFKSLLEEAIVDVEKDLLKLVHKDHD